MSSPHITQHSSPRLSTAVFSTYPSRAPTPLPNNSSTRDLNDVESDGSDADVGQDNDIDIDQDDDLDIDERSDGEDDRAAHELLHAMPTTTNVLAGGPSAILPYGHTGFAVIFLSVHYLRTLTTIPSLNRNLAMMAPCSKRTMPEIERPKHLIHPVFDVRRLLLPHPQRRNKEAPTLLPAPLAHIHRNGKR